MVIALVHLTDVILSVEYAKKKDKKAEIKFVKDETIPRGDVYKSHTVRVSSGEPPGSLSRPPAKRKPGVVRPITQGKLLRAGGPSVSALPVAENFTFLFWLIIIIPRNLRLLYQELNLRHNLSLVNPHQQLPQHLSSNRHQQLLQRLLSDRHRLPPANLLPPLPRALHHRLHGPQRPLPPLQNLKSLCTRLNTRSRVRKVKCRFRKTMWSSCYKKTTTAGG
jgi:hypothetical protein